MDLEGKILMEIPTIPTPDGTTQVSAGVMILLHSILHNYSNNSKGINFREIHFRETNTIGIGIKGIKGKIFHPQISNNSNLPTIRPLIHKGLIMCLRTRKFKKTRINS